MLTYIVRRLIQSVIVVILVTILVFVGMRLLPGDPIYMLLNPNQLQNMTAEELDKLRQEAGLDRPMAVQYFEWIGNVLRGDLGRSIMTKSPVVDDLAKRIPVTAHLGIVAFIVGTMIGIPLGIISAIRRGTWLDTLVTTMANIGITVPTFWLGIMLIWLFAIYLNWLPVMGYTSPFVDFWLSTKRLIMPVFCLAIFPIAANARQARSSMLEILRQDYIRTAWSKGLRERAVIGRHALKNSLIPIVTLAGMGISGIVGGSVLIEQVFNIPGMGRLAIDSLFQHDYTYVQGITLIMTIVIVTSNLVVDLSYGWLDPRVRYN
ncbi:MAG TPA: ABC transporter permease [Dehalococcoidales bacterium]|nr:ABC transporter permease [Dehalococcoidales bacterium]